MRLATAPLPIAISILLLSSIIRLILAPRLLFPSNFDIQRLFYTCHAIKSFINAIRLFGFVGATTAQYLQI